jgi:polysaccharide biosynthesis/export protein
MKPGSLFIVALLAPALFCHAQDKAPAAPDTTAPAAQQAAAPVAPDAAPPAMSDTYVIGESDEISISVWKEPDLSTGEGKVVTVRSDGMISMPLLGELKAAGKTPLELAAEITAKLKKYLQNPIVTVVLAGMHSKQVYLIGEITRTGPVKMTPGMTLLEAIASAGGLTQYANSRKMYILRNENGNHLKIPLQYKQALDGYDAFNLTLKPGDTIVVP